MFKQLLWKFFPRYGMKRVYNSYSKIENDVRRLFILCRFKSANYYMMGHDKLHIDPRGKCGKKGKVLCYQIDGKRWIYRGKHKKAYIAGMNCKGS